MYRGNRVLFSVGGHITKSKTNKIISCYELLVTYLILYKIAGSEFLYKAPKTDDMYEEISSMIHSPVKSFFAIHFPLIGGSREAGMV